MGVLIQRSPFRPCHLTPGTSERVQHFKYYIALKRLARRLSFRWFPLTRIKVPAYVHELDLVACSRGLFVQAGIISEG